MTQINPYQSAPAVDDSQVQLVGDLPEITIRWLFFSPRGRIPRRGLWFGSCGVGVVALSAVAALSVAETLIVRLSWSPDRMLPVLRIVASNVLALLVWCECALLSKRCHDRNRSEGRMFLWLLPTLLVAIVAAFTNQFDIPQWAWALIGGAMALTLVELGFRRGTRGPNRFGLDPTEDLRLGAVIPQNPAAARPTGDTSLRQETCPFCESQILRTQWDTCPKCERPI